MNRITVTRSMVNLYTMQVCAEADATDEEILRVCNNENDPGTEHGWCAVIRETHEEPKARPITCDDDPARTHFLVTC